MTLPTTFLSYSRRQLYFAESLALHLQKEGVDIWFDLQQLHAGKVWSEGLTEGVSEAGQMVLVVSRASLESPYTQEEWKVFAEKGNQLVLALFEPVDLPEELRGLPTYDFRSRFNSTMHDLAAFLKGEMEPRHDRVPATNRFGISTRLPGAIWLTLSAYFGCFLACVMSLLLAIALGSGKEAVGRSLFWLMTAFALLVGARYAAPLLGHALDYRKVKRGAVVNLLLLIPAFIVIVFVMEFPILTDNLGDFKPSDYFYQAIFAGFALLTLFVYLFASRRSDGLLRWMRPDEKLQRLRRRVHQPLVAKDKFDLDDVNERAASTVTYALHADNADKPIARWIEAVFQKAGHTKVAPDEDPQQHIAILSNRSSQSAVQELTRAYAGKLVFVVVSTIEFKESLTETGRYQWVDARDGDRLDIKGLARSIGDVDACRREAALETTPAMIDTWKVPTGITLLKRVMELFGIYVLVFGLTDLVGAVMEAIPYFRIDSCAESDGSVPRSILLVAVGAACFWIASKGLVYRKVAALIVYSFLGVSVVLVSLLGNVLPTALEDFSWFPPAIVLPIILFSALTSHFWLPTFAKANADEVGIRHSIDRAFRRRNLIIISTWVIVIVGIAVGIALTQECGSGPEPSTAL